MEEPKLELGDEVKQIYGMFFDSIRKEQTNSSAIEAILTKIIEMKFED